MRTDLVHKFDTSMSHVLKGLFTDSDILLFRVILNESRRVQHVGQEMLTLSGTPDLTLFILGSS